MHVSPVAAALGLLLATYPTHARTPPIGCDDANGMVEQRLLDERRESVQWHGKSPNGRATFKLMTAPNGEWSFVAISPSGRACIMVGGKTSRLISGEPT